jgi:hypothetical protein
MLILTQYFVVKPGYDKLFLQQIAPSPMRWGPAYAHRVFDRVLILDDCGSDSMNDSGKGNESLKEFREFFKFIQNLWGILAGVSVFFPLSNTFMKVIPIGQFYDEPPGSGAFQYLSSELITSVATLITIFVVFLAFSRRHKYEVQGGHALKRQARVAFILGIVSLMAYLSLNFGIYELFYGPFEIWGGDPRRMIGDVFLLLTYSGFFALVTKAFMLLGITEFYGMRE